MLLALSLALLIAAACSNDRETSPADNEDERVATTSNAPADEATTTQPDPEPATASTPVDALLVERPEWGVHFADGGVEGTFVLREAGSGVTNVFDVDRASEPRSPASTFKIFNALVLLQTGTVESVDEVFEWDGVERSIPAWNQDHSLRTGIDVSAVWLFQQLARQVGEAEMSRWMNDVGYGNAETGGSSDRFWLDGSLRISPLGQLDFLESLLSGHLPFDRPVVRDVGEIIVRETGDDWSWSYKTGLAIRADEPSLGWLVGTTQNDGRTWLFAMNIDLEPGAGVASPTTEARQEIARAVLTEAGALPTG